LETIELGVQLASLLGTQSEIETNWINENQQIITIGLKQSFKHCFLTYLAVQKLNSGLHKVILSFKR